jgi:hypothetical protein
LGSAIYFIIKNYPLFPELDSWKDTLAIINRFKAGQFPVLNKKLGGKVMHKYWAGRYKAADKIVYKLKKINIA